MDAYTVFDLMNDIERRSLHEEAARRIAKMPEAEQLFILGLLKFEEALSGQAGIECVIRWVATRQEEAHP